MKIEFLTFLSFIALFFSGCTNTVEPYEGYKLWYDEPAEKWVEALPVGNGRLGAMVYGGTENELIQVNEETVWTGQPHDYSHEGASEYLEKLRQLAREGKLDEAHRLGNEKFMSIPLRQLSYQSFVEMNLKFPGHKNATNYKRELVLGDAITSVSYEVDGTTFTREVFSSAPDQALLVKISASEKGKLNFETSLSTLHARFNNVAEDDGIVLSGAANNYPRGRNHLETPYPDSKIKFEARLKVLENDGLLAANDTSLLIKEASEVVFALVGATNFVNFQDLSAVPSERCVNDLSQLENKSYGQIKQAHINDYQSLYGRLKIDFGKTELSSRTTDERLYSFNKDEDPNMVALLYQYGRYLLISSSRNGTQPANLQGIWNNQLAPSWDSKYTLNINAEMNYWPAEITNLSECAEPFFKMVEDLSVTGEKVAKVHYDLDGWIVHHNTDIWRGAAPINNANHGIWIGGAAWLCQHLWWHYQFNGDTEFLKNKAYPLMKKAAIFYSGYLTPDPNHPEWLISGPSNSPEHGGLVMGPTMDHQLIRNLFANTIDAAKILEADNELVTELSEKRAKIAPNQIGQYGQLMEWMEDVDNPMNEHRHVSHMWGLHPGTEIHPSTTPELAEACKVSLTQRGDGGTGWARAWKINLWARLLDGDHSFLLLKNLMVPSGVKQDGQRYDGGLYANLFDAHPPFQIDGNFGATSGITEMLLQSHLRDDNGNYILDILPALPTALESGTIEGVCARGGFELKIVWADGKLERLEILSDQGNSCSIRYNNKILSIDTKIGEVHKFDGELKTL